MDNISNIVMEGGIYIRPSDMADDAVDITFKHKNFPDPLKATINIKNGILDLDDLTFCKNATKALVTGLNLKEIKSKALTHLEVPNTKVARLNTPMLTTILALQDCLPENLDTSKLETLQLSNFTGDQIELPAVKVLHLNGCKIGRLITGPSLRDLTLKETTIDSDLVFDNIDRLIIEGGHVEMTVGQVREIAADCALTLRSGDNIVAAMLSGDAVESVMRLLPATLKKLSITSRQQYNIGKFSELKVLEYVNTDTDKLMPGEIGLEQLKKLEFLELNGLKVTKIEQQTLKHLVCLNSSICTINCSAHDIVLDGCEIGELHLNHVDTLVVNAKINKIIKSGPMISIITISGDYPPEILDYTKFLCCYVSHLEQVSKKKNIEHIFVMDRGELPDMSNCSHISLLRCYLSQKDVCKLPKLLRHLWVADATEKLDLRRFKKLNYVLSAIRPKLPASVTEYDRCEPGIDHFVEIALKNKRR